jgi:glycerate kinase
MVESLEAALQRYGEMVRRDLGVDIVNLPGAGAAGGLGGGLVAFLKAQVRSGAELVAEAVGLRARLVRADIVFTGEGRIDTQTAFGKTIAVVARLAQAEGRPVVAIGGSVEGDGKALASKGVSALLSIARGPMSEAEMRENARPLLMEAAEQAMRLVLLARKLA